MVTVSKEYTAVCYYIIILYYTDIYVLHSLFLQCTLIFNAHGACYFLHMTVEYWNRPAGFIIYITYMVFAILVAVVAQIDQESNKGEENYMGYYNTSCVLLTYFCRVANSYFW